MHSVRQAVMSGRVSVSAAGKGRLIKTGGFTGRIGLWISNSSVAHNHRMFDVPQNILGSFFHSHVGASRREELEARSGIEPLYQVLQTRAYPLGHRAIRFKAVAT